MTRYAVKEIFATLQGEGARAGRAAVFLRFAGCNLWSGREEDRAAAACRFCDTNFRGTNGPGGGRFDDATSLAAAAYRAWPSSDRSRAYVVCTGGEPLLQLDAHLVDALRAEGFEVAVETNGTIAIPPGVDWICVSPKGAAPLVAERGNEMKLVFPQEDAPPERYEHLDFEHFFLQPMDGLLARRNTTLAVEYCKKNPRWRLSLQTHKLIGIP